MAPSARGTRHEARACERLCTARRWGGAARTGHDRDAVLAQRAAHLLLDGVVDGVRLDEEEGLVHGELGRVLERVAAQLLRLLEHRRHREVLHGVEERHRGALPLHLRVLGPREQRVLLDARVHDRGGRLVLIDRRRQPVQPLDQRLERARAAVHGVPPDVRPLGEPQLLPVVENVSAQRAHPCGRRVGGTEHARAELLPRQRRRVPLHRVVVDGGTWLDVVGLHGGIEAVDHVDVAHLAGLR
eukprot:scaffold94732_cov63-Phaeocystis_antarctica.AAC.2